MIPGRPPVSLQILRQQQEMKRRLSRISPRRRALAAIAGRHVRFHPENRLDPFLFAFVKEFHHAVHAAVIGDGDRIHSQLFAASNELRDFVGAVEQRVMRVDVKMNETAIPFHEGSVMTKKHLSKDAPDRTTLSTPGGFGQM